MSVESCLKCGQSIDTDFNDKCYLYGGALCDHCIKEKEEKMHYVIQDKNGRVVSEGDTRESVVKDVTDWLIETGIDVGEYGEFDFDFDLLVYDENDNETIEEISLQILVEKDYDWQSNNGTMNKACQGV